MSDFSVGADATASVMLGRMGETSARVGAWKFSFSLRRMSRATGGTSKPTNDWTSSGRARPPPTA